MTSWIASQGEFAILASLMIGGYLAAAVVLAYLPPRSKLHHAGRLAVAVIMILAVLFPAISLFSTIIGTTAAVALWAAATALSEYRKAVVHLIILVAASWLIAANPVSNAWNDYWRSDPVAVSRAGVYLAAYALVTAPASRVVAWLLSRYDLGPEVEGVSSSEGRGRVIGVLERLILLTFGLLSQWPAIGFVIAAKSIARFHDLQDRQFAEYYLLGTLASLLIVLLIAAVALVIA